MSDPLPLSDWVLHDRMAGRQPGGLLHGSSSRHLLRGLLLASNGAVVCGGGDESSLGGSDRGVRVGRKNRSSRELGRSSGRFVHYLGWRMDGYENIPLAMVRKYTRGNVSNLVPGNPKVIRAPVPYLGFLVRF